MRLTEPEEDVVVVDMAADDVLLARSSHNNNREWTNQVRSIILPKSRLVGLVRATSILGSSRIGAQYAHVAGSEELHSLRPSVPGEIGARLGLGPTTCPGASQASFVPIRFAQAGSHCIRLA
jgi:hypothetical protein